MPCRSISVDPRASTSALRSFLMALIFLSMPLKLTDQLDRQPAPGLTHNRCGLDGRDQCPRLLLGQELLCPPGCAGSGATASP